MAIFQKIWRSSAFLVSRCERADVPRTTKVSDAIHPADFDDIAANLRQCTIIPARIAR
jgi:hypothetical protein